MYFVKTASTIVVLACLSIVVSNPAGATSGPGCLVITDVEPGDNLNIRSRPNASSKIMAKIDPANQGIMHLDAKCRPFSLPWRSRWCPISYFSGNPGDPVKGWVKARFVRDSECP